ncbi:MAG TPA: aspartate carbamoyltransferase catalytic subunit [Kofleriaceae bacterium]|nr:aspartate carbamoyltransferase catalytic subunit [Kofleriaceae bacterium]
MRLRDRRLRLTIPSCVADRRRAIWGGVPRHLVSIADLDATEIVRILDRGDRYFDLVNEPIKKLTLLRGRTVINLFFENSTRTRTSFEIAAKRLSAEAINISASGSSISKGETLLDTADNLEAMYPDVIVVRHSFGGAAAMLANHVACAVVNAGDGQHEHPTQALLDAATIRRIKGRSAPGAPGKSGDRSNEKANERSIDRSIEGLEVAIVGDIAHSRVARSNILCLAKLGARIRLVAPLTLIPRGIELIGGDLTRERVRVVHRLEEGLDGVDVVMMLRIQHERTSGEAPRFPNTRELSRTFGLSERTLGFAKPDAIVMHPGPINRGVELAPQIADGPRAVILQQVSWGVAIRMAVLERAVLGFEGDGPERTSDRTTERTTDRTTERTSDRTPDRAGDRSVPA